jgi:ABC-type glycerol-3-phosphate transport system permease component
MIKEKNTLASVTFMVLNYTLLTIFFLMCTYPFYYVLIYSFSDAYEAEKGMGVLFWPVKFTLKNYSQVIAIEGIVQAAVISVLRTVIGTIPTVLCCSFFGYLVTKPLYARKFIYRFVVATMYFSSGLIPWYLTISHTLMHMGQIGRASCRERV